MADFFAELKRRHIYRVGAAYVVVAWALTQVIDVMSQIFELPGSIARPAVIVLALGFPIALVAVWLIESKPHEAVVSAVRSKPTIVDWALCAALALVLVVIGYQQISAPSAQQLGVDAAREAAASPVGAISIAVLPFANLSGDPSQEFFSDGMTEEITSALARVPDLRVVARTSAYQFRDQNRDIQSIGQQLRATHFIEGSVRKAGDRVRITAQLINSDDGTHVWAENYDRELTDVFAIQEDIAKAIAGALRVPLGLASTSLVPNQTKDLDSYQQYLRARTLIRTRLDGPLREAAVLLEQVTARESNFAPAWAILALAYVLTPGDSVIDHGDPASIRAAVAVELPKAEAAAQRAIQLDPKLAAGYMALGRVAVARAKWAMAEDLYAKSLELDPYDTDGLTLYSNVLATVGRLKEALAVKQRVLALEPFVPAFSSTIADVLWLNGQNDSAIALLKTLPPGVAIPATNLARVYTSMGRYNEAADSLLSLPPGAYPPGTVEQAARLLRTAPTTMPSPQSIPYLGELSFVFLHVGAPERVLEPNEARLEGGYSVAIRIAHLWHPSYSSLRKTERFETFVRKAGLTDYWRAKGWPDLCRPVGADDFECD